MLSLTRQLGTGSPARACASVCGHVSGDLAKIELLRKVWGVCLGLRITLTSHCTGK